MNLFDGLEVEFKLINQLSKMQIRSVQGLAPQQRQVARPLINSTLRSKNCAAQSDAFNADLPRDAPGDSAQQVNTVGATGAVSGSDENSRVNTNIASTKQLPNKTLSERNMSKQTANVAMSVTGTQVQPRVSPVESNSKQRRDLQLKQQLSLQKRVTTVEGFILGVMEEDDETPDGTPLHRFAMVPTQVIHQHHQVIHDVGGEQDADEDGVVSHHNLVFDNTMMMPRTQQNESVIDEGSKLPTARNEDAMLPQEEDVVVKQASQPIKVLATTTTKKVTLVEAGPADILHQKHDRQQQQINMQYQPPTDRFDLISNSLQMESAMKPVRMASGYSDDATPMSQPNLQPRGLQIMQNGSTVSKQDPTGHQNMHHEVDHKKATQFTVLTSHYQEQQLQMAHMQQQLQQQQQQQQQHLLLTEKEPELDQTLPLDNKRQTTGKQEEVKFALLKDAPEVAGFSLAPANNNNAGGAAIEQSPPLPEGHLKSGAHESVAADPLIGSGIVQKDQRMLGELDQIEMNQMLLTQKSGASPRSFKLPKAAMVGNTESNHSLNQVGGSRAANVAPAPTGSQLLVQAQANATHKANRSQSSSQQRLGGQGVRIGEKADPIASPLVISQMRPKSKKSVVGHEYAAGYNGLVADDDYRMLQNNCTTLNYQHTSSHQHYLGAFKQTTFRKKRSTSSTMVQQRRQQQRLREQVMVQEHKIDTANTPHQEIVGKQYKLTAEVKKGGASGAVTQLSMPKRMRTSFEIQNRRIIVSNDSWQSSNNSMRLNQDIMSAKIESCFLNDGPPEAIIIPTQGPQSSSSFGEPPGFDRVGDYTIGPNTILVQKLAVASSSRTGGGDVLAVPAPFSEKHSSSKKKKRKVKQAGVYQDDDVGDVKVALKDSNAAVFATVEAQQDQATMLLGSSNSPLLKNAANQGASPKRKSVLTRNSKASPIQQKEPSQHQREDASLRPQKQQSHIQTLRGTISSQGHGEVRAESSLQLQGQLARSNELDVVKKDDMNFHSEERPELTAGPSVQLANSGSVQRPPLNIVGEREVSGFTLKRDSSEEIQISSNVLLSRVASNEPHAETMREEFSKPLDQDKPEMSSEERQNQQCRKKALSMETASQDLIASGTEDISKTPYQVKSVPRDKFQSTTGKNLETPQEQRLANKRSSHAFVATSLGDESFIQPPSPIHQNQVRRLYDSKYVNTNSPTKGNHSPEDKENSGSDVTFIKQQAKGSQMLLSGVKGAEALRKSGGGQSTGEENATALQINAQSTHEVVDVMHAGVDTQDFVELSDGGHTIQSQSELLMVDRDHATAILMGQLDPQKTAAGPGGKINLNLARTQGAGMQSELRSGLNSSLASKTPSLENTMTASLKKLKAGQTWPVVSCLCKELELTPEQFGEVVQQYKRQPRVILKSYAEPNRILLVNPDGTSKDENMMQDIVQGTIKIDGVSIRRLVAENREYFDQLRRNENSPHRQRRVQPANSVSPGRRGSDFLIGSSTNRTIDRNLMTQQLAQFVQYGQEFSGSAAHGTISSNAAASLTQSLLKSRHQSNVLHSKCDAMGGSASRAALAETELNTPAVLLSSQYFPAEQQSSSAKRDATNQQVFKTSRNATDYQMISAGEPQESRTGQLVSATGMVMTNGKAPGQQLQSSSMLEDHPYSNTTMNLAGGASGVVVHHASQPSHRMMHHQNNSMANGEQEDLNSASYLSNQNVESEMMKDNLKDNAGVAGAANNQMLPDTDQTLQFPKKVAELEDDQGNTMMVHPASNYTSWARMTGAVGTASNEQIDTEQEGNTKFNSIQRQEIDDIVPDTLSGLVPTKVEIIRPGLRGLVGRRTLADSSTKEQLNARGADLTNNNDLKIREINSQVNTPGGNMTTVNNQQEYIIKMDGSYYLDHPLTKSTDMKSQQDHHEQRLTTDLGQNQQRQRTPYLGKQRHRTKTFRQGGQQSNKMQEHQHDLRESCGGGTSNYNYRGSNKLISQAVTMKGNVSNMSGFNKRSTLSKDCDISTQRRHSNEASRYNVDEEDDEMQSCMNENQHRGSAGTANNVPGGPGLSSSRYHHQMMHQYHSSAIQQHNHHQTTPINMAESVAQAKQQKAAMQQNQQYPMRATMQYRSNPRRKRSQIGALAAANCRLTPNSIELKISKGHDGSATESTPGYDRIGEVKKTKEEKDVLSREIQVIKSKKGMIADISRTFSTAMTHKTNLIQRTGCVSGFVERTRIGARQLQSTEESRNTAVLAKGSGGEAIATGVHTASLHTAKLQNDVDGKSASKHSLSQGVAAGGGNANSRQPAFQVQQNQILNKLLGAKLINKKGTNANQQQAQYHTQQKAAMMSASGASSSKAIGGLDDPENKLNMDLPVTQASPCANPSTEWTGFNATRRLTTNQVPKRNQIMMGYAARSNQPCAASDKADCADRDNNSMASSMQLVQQQQPSLKLGPQSSQDLGQTACSNTSQQMLMSNMAAARQQLSGGNLLLYDQNANDKRNSEMSDELASQETRGIQGTSSVMNVTAAIQHPYFKRVPGDPLVRITKSSVAQNRSRLAQKSASLLRGSAKRRLTSMKSIQRTCKRASPKAQTRFSVERMIRELGDHQSELNLQLLNKVSQQAGFKSGLIDATNSAAVMPQQHQSNLQIIEDYGTTGIGQDQLHTRQFQTSNNFFSAATLDKMMPHDQMSMSFHLQSQIGEMTNTTTGDKSNSLLPLNKSKNKKSAMDQLKLINGSRINMKLEAQALSFNRAVGSLLPSKNQADGDLIPMDPIQQMISLNRRGELPATSSINEPAVMNYRTRVQSQNQQKRRKHNQAATGIYYEMRKKSFHGFDLAQVQSMNFTHIQDGFQADEFFRLRNDF